MIRQETFQTQLCNFLCRYLMSMALLLLRLAMGEILKSSDRKSSNKGDIFLQFLAKSPAINQI